MSPLFFQMTPIARRKDAVGRMALAIQALAAEEGYRSLLFTERQSSLHLGAWWFGPLRRGLLVADPAWGGEPASPVPDVALYHHSIGTVVADRFLAWPARKKVLVYHNITPDRRPATEWGREQLGRLVRESHLQIGLSRFSCDELSKAGAARCVQLPYLLWQQPDVSAPRPPRTDEAPLVLVVGRVVRHKRVLEAVRAFADVHARHPARLAIVGNLRADPEYVAEVRAAVRAAGLEHAVQLPGKISDRALHALYREASALLTLSDHEGFCVPIAEAMRAGVPIVARGAGAIPETLGTGGLLLESASPDTAAPALERVLFDPATRERLARAQAEEAPRFHPEVFAARFRAALASL